jgi:hypothetical protein
MDGHGLEGGGAGKKIDGKKMKNSDFFALNLFAS